MSQRSHVILRLLALAIIVLLAIPRARSGEKARVRQAVKAQVERVAAR